MKIVPKTKNNVYTLFGKKYERVPIIDNRLDGAVYYLVSGHGGPDPGALGKYGNRRLAKMNMLTMSLYGWQGI